MADRYTISADAVALTASTAKTVLQLGTPSTTRARLLGITIAFDGVTASNKPVLLEMLRQTGTGTGTAANPVPIDPAAPAALCSGLKNHTVEPGGSTVVWTTRLSPVGGLLVVPFYGDEQPVIAVSSWIGMRCTADNGVNVSASMTYME